jgi:hypothetical protein
MTFGALSVAVLMGLAGMFAPSDAWWAATVSILCAVGVVGTFTASIAYHFWSCPRCGKRWMSLFWSGFTWKCAACGLPRRANGMGGVVPRCPAQLTFIGGTVLVMVAAAFLGHGKEVGAVLVKPGEAFELRFRPSGTRVRLWLHYDFDADQEWRIAGTLHAAGATLVFDFGPDHGPVDGEPRIEELRVTVSHGGKTSHSARVRLNAVEGLRPNEEAIVRGTVTVSGGMDVRALRLVASE